jgi:hypothetical protein
MGSDRDEFQLYRKRERHADRYGRIGRCRVCGEPVLWWNTEWRARVPLDPLPVLNVNDHTAEGGQFFVPKGRTAVAKLNPDETGQIFIYRLHNDGRCLRAQRDGG